MLKFDTMVGASCSSVLPWRRQAQCTALCNANTDDSEGRPIDGRDIEAIFGIFRLLSGAPCVQGVRPSGAVTRLCCGQALYLLLFLALGNFQK